MNGWSVREHRIANCQRGFTLIELLVVLAIIILPLSIFLPTIKRSKVASQQTVCGGMLQKCGFGLGMFEGEHCGKAPPAILADVPKEPWINGGFSAALVGGQYLAPNMLWCPAANDIRDRVGVFDPIVSGGGKLSPYDKTVKDSSKQAINYKDTYCVSAFLGWSAFPYSRMDEVAIGRGDNQRYADLISRPARRTASEIDSRPILFDGCADGLVWDDGWCGAKSMPGRVAPRHGGNGVTALFGDGHAESRTLSNPLYYNTMVKTLEWHPAKTADGLQDGYWTKYYW